MSNTSSNQGAVSASEDQDRLRSWPDLSEYGLYFGVLEMPDGSQRLVMVDQKAQWASLAHRMGFQQSRWLGVWVRTDLKFTIPNYTKLFPKGRAVEMTEKDIRNQIKIRIQERREMRLSQAPEEVRKQQMAGAQLGWRQSPAKPAPMRSSAAPAPSPMRPIAAAARPLPLAPRVAPAAAPVAPARTARQEAPPPQPTAAVAPRPGMRRIVATRRMEKPDVVAEIKRAVASHDAPSSAPTPAPAPFNRSGTDAEAFVARVNAISGERSEDDLDDDFDTKPVEHVVEPSPRSSYVEETEVAGPVDVASAMRQTRLLGLNHLGQSVYESGDGFRFVKDDSGEVSSKESQIRPDAVYLRASTETDASTGDALQLCAQGLVLEIERGKNLHSEDFVRYIEAALGAGASQVPALVSAFQYEIDGAMLAAASRGSQPDKQTFDVALQLHDGRPSFWRPAGTLPTPLPIAVALQSIVQEALDGFEGAKVIDISSGGRDHSWLIDGSIACKQAELEPHRFALGGIFGSPLNLEQSGKAMEDHGIRVTRADHLAILNALKIREDNGQSAFIIAGDRVAGAVAPDMRRLLSHVGARYEIKGLVDIDPAMVATGNEISSRLVVIGSKRQEVDDTYSVPSHINVIRDYDSLWTWSEIVRADDTNSLTFGEDGRSANRWQAPYIPSSQITEPKAMSPRNLLGPVRKALSRIIEQTGMGIDEFVADRLQWSLEEMEAKGYLDAEQVDAVALMIHAEENGYAFVEADATGLGKGRVLAAFMRYRRLQGKTVVFITENDTLFRDIYRDIADLDSLELFANPLILNRNVTLRLADGSVIGQSLSTSRMREIYMSERIPAEHPFVMGTFSQMNRTCLIEPGFAARINSVLVAHESGQTDRHSEISRVSVDLGINLDLVRGLTTNDDAIAALEAELERLATVRQSSKGSGANDKSLVELEIERHIELRKIADDEFLERVKGTIPTQMTQLKLSWLRSDAVADTSLVIDESHNAAGPTSTTNANMLVTIERAGSVMFSSATFAKEAHNFSIYKPIFPRGLSSKGIEDAIARGGEPVQEILTAALAEDGRMIRREHDNSNVEFRVLVDENRLSRNEQWSDSLASVLVAMSRLSGEVAVKAKVLDEEHQKKLEEAQQAAKAAAEVARATGQKVRSRSIPEVGVKYSTFSSRFYNITRAFMLAINGDNAADAAIQARKEGRKPFIIIENTMESILAEMLRDDFDGAMQDLVDDTIVDSLATTPVDADREVDSKNGATRLSILQTGKKMGFRELLHRYADNVFFAWEVKYRGKTVVSRKRLELKVDGGEKALKLIRELIDRIPDVPLSPLDMFRERIESAGLSFREITGRKLRLETQADGTHAIVRFNKPERWESVDAFNGGDADVLLASKSGSTGISVHAGSKFRDQSQREAIEWQAISNVVGRQQSHGRHNRKDQVCSPMVTSISSGLPGETRLQMMQNRALRKVSAITSGNADNAAIDLTVPDLINSVGNEICFRWLESNPSAAELLGIDTIGVSEGDPSVRFGTKWVDALTGRIMMLPVSDQRTVYKQLDSEFKAVIEQYELEGRNPLKSGHHDIRAKKVRSRVFELSPYGGQGVFSQPVNLVELEYEVNAKPMDVEAMKADARASQKALVERHGEKFIPEIHKIMERVADQDMVKLLSSKHSSVNDALADEETNRVQNYYERVKLIQKGLGVFRPGNLIRTEDDHGKDLMFITAIELPEEESRYCAPSDYKVRFCSAYTRRRATVSLSALMTRSSTTLETPKMSDDGADLDRMMATYRDLFEKEETWVVNRVILDGNLFRAAMIADRVNTGQAITYTDDRGICRQAILLPAKYGFSNVDALMPVMVDTPEVMRQVLQVVEAEDMGGFYQITDHLKHDKRTFAIHYNGTSKEFGVAFYKGADNSGWIWRDEQISSTFAEDISGTRVKRVGKIDRTKLAQFCEAFIEKAHQRGTPLVVEGSIRSRLNDLIEKERIAKEIALQQSMQALNQEPEDDLSKLKALGF